MPKDASAIYQSQVGGYGELERLSALETLKGLKNPDGVTLRDLVRFLDSRGLWSQFAKITLGDLREAFKPPAADGPAPRRTKKKKARILEDELGDAYAEKDQQAKSAKEAPREPVDGGMDTEEFARLVLPFVEGNGDVTLDDLDEYCDIDRKAIRHHLSALVKEGRLERIGVGRHAVYSSAL
jgi:DNA-binding transcriptional ArsR family regulator